MKRKYYFGCVILLLLMHAATLFQFNEASNTYKVQLKCFRDKLTDKYDYIHDHR